VRSPTYDVVIKGGLFFDGTGARPAIRHIGIADGRVASISESPLFVDGHTEVIDAEKNWVMPGFIDMHTHYDAELELAPSLSESVRHGVTTVILGSCSLSLALGEPEDLADMFCRVEGVPYGAVRTLLEERKTWNTHREYFDHLASIPLGANVASYCGHSAIRAHAMGVARSLARGVLPTPEETRRMKALLNEALDAGCVGLSVMTLPWDKMGGSREYRSRPLPSAYARWSEYRALTSILRQRGSVLQGVPNYITQLNAFLFVAASLGWFRKPLKTTILTLMDVRADRKIWLLSRILSTFANLLGGRFRWQALPELFDLWIDGMDVVVFEEFRAGGAALHLQEPDARRRLLLDAEYRQRFKRDWRRRFLPRMFHRDFNEARILDCPDPSVVGRSFADVARERGQDPVDTFLDLVAAHGSSLRWYTVMANDRRRPLERMMRHAHILVGFSDAGAHLRNMAHYNFPLRLLKLVRDAEKRGEPFMSVERAVHRVTGELGAWFGIDAGTLELGRRADLVVVDPEGLDARLDAAEEAPMPGIPGLQRMVRRNDGAVRAVLVNGRVAVQEGTPLAALGVERGFGRPLQATAAG
jgi:N-acyl-D-aspartate/D-glutamate deacylase